MKDKDLIKELRSISLEELQRRLDRVGMELTKFYLKKSIKRLENVALIRKHKKEIARIHTIITEKSSAAAKGI